MASDGDTGSKDSWSLSANMVPETETLRLVGVSQAIVEKGLLIFRSRMSPGQQDDKGGRVCVQS